MAITPEQFVGGLRERDTTLGVKNNRLKLYPGNAWKTLTEDEIECLRLHRPAIKLLVEDADEPLPAPAPEPGTEKTEPTPEPAVWTSNYSRRITSQDLHDAGVRGSNKAAYEKAREWLVKQNRDERAKRATATMYESLRRHQRDTHGGYRA